MEPTEPSLRADGDDSVGIVILTHGRVHLLRKCVENTLAATSEATREIVIWNNGSTDGTREYLDTIDDPRVRVVHNEQNIGQNAYAPAFEMISAPYLVELDDDVVDAPQDWDKTMRDALKRLPNIGFLAADLEDDPYDETAHYRYRVRPHEYTPIEVNGVRLLEGPAGGTCAMLRGDVYRKVGGFPQDSKWVFWQEEPAYIALIKKLGYDATVLADLKVHHTGGRHYCEVPRAKTEFWDSYWKTRARRLAVKKMVFRMPFFKRLNARYGWFVAPS
ncbi:MAG TPA: glycosyltransferase [Gaiellaceae bacterium]